MNIANIGGGARGYDGQGAWDMLVAAGTPAGNSWPLFYDVVEELTRTPVSR